MIQKLLSLILILALTFILRNEPIDIKTVFNELEDKTVQKDKTYKNYLISYEDKNLTTNNILNELKFLEGEKNIKITIITEILDEQLEYKISSSNLKDNLSSFFYKYISILEQKEKDDEIVKAYSYGIKINKLIITMPPILANNYFQNKDLKYKEIQ